MRTWILVAAVVFSGCQAEAPELSPAELQAKFEHEEKSLWKLHDDWHELNFSRASAENKQLAGEIQDKMGEIDGKIDEAIIRAREAAKVAPSPPDWGKELLVAKTDLEALKKMRATLEESSKSFNELKEQALANTKSATDFDSAAAYSNSATNAGIAGVDAAMKLLENTIEIRRKEDRINILTKLTE